MAACEGREGDEEEEKEGGDEEEEGEGRELISGKVIYRSNKTQKYATQFVVHHHIYTGYTNMLVSDLWCAR